MEEVNTIKPYLENSAATNINNQKAAGICLDQNAEPLTDNVTNNSNDDNQSNSLERNNDNDMKNTKLYLKFRKSHTCGSLFANCNCDSSSASSSPITPITSIRKAPTKTHQQQNNINDDKQHHNHNQFNRSFDNGNTQLQQQQNQQSSKVCCADNFVRSKNNSTSRLFKSYLHPDTTFIFTDENRNPAKISTNKNTRNNSCQCSKTSNVQNSSTSLTGRNEIKYPKRSSSPNIGHCTILNDNIESDKIDKIRKFSIASNQCKLESKFKTEIIQEDYLSISNKENQFDLKNLPDQKNETVLRSQKKNLTQKNEQDQIKFLIDKKKLDTAQKYFLESGILGPIIKPNTVKLIRKTSKIMEEVRKNSKIIHSNSKSLNGTACDVVDSTKSIELTTNDSDNSIDDDILFDSCGCENGTRVRSLLDEVVNLKDTVKIRDNEIHKLKREIHKLKSVLQQTANHIPFAGCNLLVSLQTQHGITSHNTAISQNATNAQNACNNINNNSEFKYSALVGAPTASVSTTKTIVDSDMLQCSSKLNSQHLPQVIKKQGVSGESCDSAIQLSQNIPIPKYDKDFRSKQLIKDAIIDNDFLKNIDSSQVRELVESMYNLEIAKGEYVIREGEAGAHLYVSAEGEFEVIKNGNTLGVIGPGKAFGELAILYNCTRTASIRIVSDAKVWVLDRRIFQQIMMRTGMQRIEDNVRFLRSVPLLKNLSNDVLAKIADVLEVEFYPAGTYIIRQGHSGDTFFLISQGTVTVTQKLGNSTEEKEIRTLERGDYFGEQALINEDKRTANIIAQSPGVECLTLDRQSFSHLIGDLCELKQKNYDDENRVLAMKCDEKTPEIFGANVKQEFPELKLTDMEVIATLGIGGFGRVELIKCYRENSVETYALKCLKKKHIIDTRQEEHVFSERTIMLSCNTPFICRLYRTFRDSKYLYMMLEACMGGEVWTILRDRGSFDENTTQFIIGCVLEAFEYLHSRGIIYRDLKPENLMLDERGYVKLVDFGFAKYIGVSQKTWTFCGTPEYVAPEIILNKGHDRAVDYWALGILIHELLNGTPPFAANDPMKTYNIILKGIDLIDFPKHMSRSSIMLIKKLCRDVPVERLGYQKGGIQDIKKHKWFQGFDWESLSSLTLIPPFLRPVSHPLDTCYFDKFPADTNEPPDETSGWDSEF